MIISFMNQKGGAGKTTLSTNLARYFHLQGESIIFVDADPQGSARDWHSASENPLINMVAIDRPTLDKDIKAVSDKYKWVFIDCPGRLESMNTAAIKCSDVVLIPVQPSPYDIWATSDIVDLIKTRQEITDGKPKAAFIISRHIPNTIVSKEVEDALNEYDLPVFKNRTSQRMSYIKTAASGSSVIDSEPNSDPANEIKLIAEEIMEFVK